MVSLELRYAEDGEADQRPDYTRKDYAGPRQRTSKNNCEPAYRSGSKGTKSRPANGWRRKPA
jgi:hypothetical protein